METKQNTSTGWFAALVLMLAIMFATLFCDWLGSYEQTTLPKIARVLSELSRYSRGITLLTVLIYIALAVSTICGIVTLCSLANARGKSMKVSKAGFVGAIILSALVIFTVWIVNVSNIYIFEMTYIPFCVLTAGIGGCILCGHMTPETQDVQQTRKMHATIEKNYCPKCKKCVEAHGKYCTACGTELIADTVARPQCGAAVPRSAAFCPICSQDMSAHSNTDDYHCEYCGALLSADAIRELDLKYCPECGMAIGLKVKMLYQCRGACPVCGNTRMLSEFCPACGHKIPEEIFEATDTPV